MYETVLAIHIAGACATGIAASYAGMTLWKHQDHSYRSVALVLGALAGFEVLTGTLLAVISAPITAASLCANIAVYLSAVFLVEALVIMRMHKVSLVAPLVRIFAPVASSLALFAGALAFGV